MKVMIVLVLMVFSIIATVGILKDKPILMTVGMSGALLAIEVGKSQKEDKEDSE